MLVSGNGGGIPLVLFPTSFGRCCPNKNFGVVGACSHFIAGVRHWLDDRRWCGHDCSYWRDMLPYYLSTP